MTRHQNQVARLTPAVGHRDHPRVWEMPPEPPENLVPGWRWHRGGDQGWSHSRGQLSPAEPPAPLWDRAAARLCSGTGKNKLFWRQRQSFRLAAAGHTHPCSQKHSCGAPTASMPSQVDSATEHFLRKVLLSLTSNHRLYLPRWKMKPTAKWKCFQKGYPVPKNTDQ